MAKVLERREALYDEDLLAWAERQAEPLCAGQLDRLDVARLIDELEAIAGKLRRELKNRLRILLAHLLECQHQPRRRSHSCATSIAEQRDQISALLEENPSLRPHVETLAVSVRFGRRRSKPGCGGTASPEICPMIGLPCWGTTTSRTSR